MVTKTFDYDSFNARYSSYKQVADSFIPNPQFEQLQSQGSILLMGSRGCGKTTLLKMLTPVGIKYYSERLGDASIFQNNFTAIYIPCDIQWKSQLEHLKSKLGEDNKEFYEIIAQFLFATNVQIAMCKSFNSVININNSEQEFKLRFENLICKDLISVWNIETPSIATFDDIEAKLLARVLNINQLLNKLIFQKKNENLIDLFPNYIFSSFFDLVKLGCKVFEQKMKLEDEHRWALCFDELEIAPKFLQLTLIKYLRSVDQKYFFKLTTTPLFNLDDNIIEASQGNDYSTIKLWVYDQTGLAQWRKFCSSLVTSRIAKQFKNSSADPKKIFGEYQLDTLIKDEISEIDSKKLKAIKFIGNVTKGEGKGSAVNFLFKYLANEDSTFNKFLSKRGIDANDPYAKNDSQSKSIFLKYKLDAIYRMIFYKRTRKNPSIHYGVPYIYDICDGNPRFIIGLVDEILRRAKFDVENDMTIPKNIQSSIILEASKKYYNLLQNHPDSTITLQNSEFNLANNIISPIGKYIHSKIVQDEFSVTSPSTFMIDEDVNKKHEKLLETALYLGAIIYLDPIESLSNSGIVGKRFRLSSFLNPKFQIPDRISSRVNLSTILKIEDQKNQIKLDIK